MCLYSFIKYKDTMAGGFSFSLFFFSAMYGYWSTASVDITVRQVWVRLGLLLLILIIGIWRSVELVRGGRNGS